MKVKLVLLVCLFSMLICMGCSSNESSTGTRSNSSGQIKEDVASTPEATSTPTPVPTSTPTPTPTPVPTSTPTPVPTSTPTPTPEPEPELEFIGKNLHDVIVALKEMGVDKNYITYETDKGKTILATSNWEIVDVQLVNDSIIHFVCTREAYINPLRGAAKTALDIVSSDTFNKVMDKLSTIKDRVETVQFVFNSIKKVVKH